MQVLVEVLANDGVAVDAYAHLLQESINISVYARLPTLLHDNHGIASIFDVVPDVLQLVAREGHTRTTQKQQLCSVQLLHSDLFLVDRTLNSMQWPS